MPMTDGELLVTSNYIIKDRPYSPFHYDGAKLITESRNLEYGNNSQSLTDIFLSKLLEGILGKAEILKESTGVIRIDYTDAIAFWVTIKPQIDGSFILIAEEPAA